VQVITARYARVRQDGKFFLLSRSILAVGGALTPVHTGLRSRHSVMCFADTRVAIVYYSIGSLSILRKLGQSLPKKRTYCGSCETGRFDKQGQPLLPSQTSMTAERGVGRYGQSSLGCNRVLMKGDWAVPGLATMARAPTSNSFHAASVDERSLSDIVTTSKTLHALACTIDRKPQCH
jgi:hypothetical protein